MYYYVYILKSDKDDNFYVGYTNNLKQRLALHNDGKVQSTKNRRPLNLVHFEGCMNLNGDTSHFLDN